MSSPPTQDELDAKLAAAEARTDTKFAELRADIRVLDSKLTALPSSFTVIATIAGTGVAVAGVILAALAFASSLFGQGFNAYDVAHKAAIDAVAETRSAGAHH